MNVNRQYANTFAGHAFYFHDLAVVISYDMWDKHYTVMVWRPGQDHGQRPPNDKKIACFSFSDIEDAIEICEYILIKIALADALFGWIY